MQPTQTELLEQIADILSARQAIASWAPTLAGIRQFPHVRLLMAEDEALIEAELV